MINREELMKSNIANDDVTDEAYCVEILKSPFILVRIISSFLSDDEEEDLSRERKLPQNERDTIIDILEQVGLIDIPLVKKHLSKLVVK